MYCTNCGTSNQDDAIYCKQCGATLQETKDTSQDWENRCEPECTKGSKQIFSFLWTILIIIIGLWIVFTILSITVFLFFAIIPVIITIFAIILIVRLLTKQ